MSAKKNNKTVKYVVEVLAILVGAFIALGIKPTEALSAEALRTLGIFIWGVVNLVLNLVDPYVTTLAMGALWYATKCVPFGTAFSGFSGTTFWLIVGVMGIGAAVRNSGLLKRLSLYSMKWFKPTYTGQVLAIIVMGIIIAPFIPSTSAKVAIMGALVLGISDELGLPKRGPGRFGLLMALWIGFNFTGNLYVNASFQGYTVLGLLPEATQAEYTWITWFLRSLPWAAVVIVGFYFWIRYAYKEPNSKEISKEYIDEQFRQIGGLSKDEKITAAVAVICLILFIFEKKTGIGSVVVCVMAMVVLTFAGVIGKKEFVNNTLWPLVVFIGMTLGFGSVFKAVGISDWLVSVLEPIARSVSNPFLFVTALCVLTYIVSIFVAQTASNTLMVAILYPLAVNLGMDPWVACVVIYGSSVIFYPTYTHSNILISLGAVGGEENIDEKYMLMADVVYMILNWLGFMVSVPIWKAMGML